MVGTKFHGDLEANALQVGASLIMRSEGAKKTSLKNVDLLNARIGSQLEFSGATLDGLLDAEGVQVGGGLLMSSEGENIASFKSVKLNRANIAGRINMDGAIFADEIVAQGLHAGGDVSMRHIYTDSPLTLRFAQFGGNVDLGGANLETLDLRGATITGEFRLGDKTSMVGWLAPEGQTESIDLRNAHLGSISDNEYSWPKNMHLDGLMVSRLGGFEAGSGAEMVRRGADWWDRNFARLDNDFTSSPYEQLAAVFTSAGDHDAADGIRYQEQIRAAEKSGVLSFADSTVMRWGAGYGIGSYMFRALYWAIGLSLLGALILRFRVKGVTDRNRGFVWCFGASVNKLLPGINLKKEFADFFDDPARNKFTLRQDFFFVVLASLGWVLSLIVLAAFATITHGP